MRKYRFDHEVAVYRCYSADGELLYIGHSNAPDRRISGHALERDWRVDMRRIEVEWFPNREAAAAAEAAAIRAERPKHNKTHNKAMTPCEMAEVQQ